MQRLHRRFNRMLERGKPRPKVVVAIARELTGFVWAAMRLQPPGPSYHHHPSSKLFGGRQSTDEGRHDPEDTRRSFATGRLRFPDSRDKTALPLDGERSCGSAPRATREYQSDSSSKRPASSVVFGLRGGPTNGNGRIDGNERTKRKRTAGARLDRGRSISAASSNACAGFVCFIPLLGDTGALLTRWCEPWTALDDTGLGLNRGTQERAIVVRTSRHRIANGDQELQSRPRVLRSRGAVLKLLAEANLTLHAVDMYLEQCSRRWVDPRSGICQTLAQVGPRRTGRALGYA